MKTTEKLDLYQQNKLEYVATPKPALVETHRATYLCIDGKGTPGGANFTEAVGALYGVAYTVKMTHKFAGRQDYSVCKLEALWPDSISHAAQSEKNNWTWQLLIRTPDFIAQRDIDQAVETLEKRGRGETADRVQLRTLDEGLCVQALHVGPYSTEEVTIAAMQAFAGKKGMQIRGAHHEIYLSDPRRTDPSKLKTILREPVVPAALF